MKCGRILLVALLAFLALALSRLPASAGPSATVTIGSGSVTPGESITVPVEALGVPNPGLAAVTIDVHYDPTVLDATGCDSDPNGAFNAFALCNVNYEKNDIGTDIVRSGGIHTQGVSGDVLLANITFQAVGYPGDTSPLDVVIVTFADFNGDGIPAIDQDGSIDVLGPPTAATWTYPTTPVINAGDLIIFFAGYSYDPDLLDVLSYQWDLGDGTTSTLVAPYHFYTVPGVYNVSLTVCDEGGLCDTDTRPVYVKPFDLGGNGPPTAATWTFPTSPVVNAGNPGDISALVIFFAGYSYDPDLLDVFSYQWDLGDGTTSNLSSTYHFYSEPGVYNVSVTVCDGGGLCDTDTRPVYVLP